MPRARDLVGYQDAAQTDNELWGVPPELELEGATVIAIIQTVSDGLEKIVEQAGKQLDMNEFLAYLGRVDQKGEYSALFQRDRKALTKDHQQRRAGSVLFHRDSPVHHGHSPGH